MITNKKNDYIKIVMWGHSIIYLITIAQCNDQQSSSIVDKGKSFDLTSRSIMSSVFKFHHMLLSYMSFNTVSRF